MPSHTVALEQCFNEVTDSAPLALERCLDSVVAALQDAEGKSASSSERSELGDAWRELLQHKTSWVRRYPDELRAALRSAREPKSSSHPKPGDDIELSLVDHDEIMEAIQAARLVQNVMPLLETPVSELDALVSSAMGLESVRAEVNPVRPEVFAQTLRALVGRTEVNAATASLCMKYLAEPLGVELQQLYGRLVTQLRDANVHAAAYRRTLESESGSGGGSSASQALSQDANFAPQEGARSVAGASGFSPLSTQQISHSLLRAFLLRDDPRSSQALPASYYAEVDRELVQLADSARADGVNAQRVPLPDGYRELSVVERPALPIGVQSTLSSEVWGQYGDSHERSLVRSRLRKDATRVAQVLGLELVRKVVNEVARDPRLLAPLREALVALEPSLLRLAMVDPRFFSDEQHPGRVLLERVAQRSFKYNDEFSSDFALFFDQVGHEFAELNSLAIDSGKPFESALAALEGLWAEQDGAEAQQRGRIVDMVRFAELRQAEADQIAWELSTRSDLDQVPSVIQDFLFGSWALVMAHARLTDTAHQVDPHGYMAVISDLLWSVKREVILREPGQLFVRVPPLLSKLREGLALLGQDPVEHEPFFRAMMKLHHPVLKLRRAKSRRDARESGMTPLDAFDPEMAAPEATSAPAPLQKAEAGQPWMSPRELDAAGFEETLPTDMGQLTGGEESEPEPEPTMATPEPAPSVAPMPPKRTKAAKPEPLTEGDIASILARLREGDWFDLYSKRRWRRAQLTWAAAKGTLFMFVSHGGRPHSMTRRICERLIRDRLLRPVRSHGVVAQALGALEQDQAASGHAPL